MSESSAVENTVVENTVVKNTVVENTVVENTVVENAVVENAVVENAVVENAVVENAVVENAVVENAVVENAVVENDVETKIISILQNLFVNFFKSNDENLKNPTIVNSTNFIAMENRINNYKRMKEMIVPPSDIPHAPILIVSKVTKYNLEYTDTIAYGLFSLIINIQLRKEEKEKMDDEQLKQFQKQDKMKHLVFASLKKKYDNWDIDNIFLSVPGPCENELLERNE